MAPLESVFQVSYGEWRFNFSIDKFRAPRYIWRCNVISPMARNQKAVGLNLQRKTLYLTRYLTEELDALVRRDAYQS